MIWRFITNYGTPPLGRSAILLSERRDVLTAATESADELVDVFVSYLNGAGFEPKFPDEIPEELRTSSADYGTFKWQIHPPHPTLGSRP